MKDRFKWDVRPNALKENIVKGKNYRFTVLTKNLIRMEYSPIGKFEDRASQVVFYRDFLKVEYKTDLIDGILTINTGELILTYKENEIFNADTLQIKLLTEPASTYNFGDKFETLGGTAKTLDGAYGEIPLGEGLISRGGFSVLDDSQTLALGEDGWPEERTPKNTDIYFFGYGFKYNDCIKDFYFLTGRPPLLPAYALGNWWSRYHKYTDKEYLALMEKFKQKDVPFSVGVIDMDWHIVNNIPEDKYVAFTPEEKKNYWYGWTGYTWNKELFPDYKGFLKKLHKYNIKASLNLHPADGVRPHEAQYEQMCLALGQDSKKMEAVKFDVLNKDFMANYFDILHHPYEENGIDFWWMDWQQGTDYSWLHEANKNGKYKDGRERIDPLWMLNHLHILDISRNGLRPMFFSRYSGPGSHRYPVGFSGDTVISWESLRFQPEFTATATNIGYTWWSHDIGGHFGGYQDNELYCRWVQLGVFSPINRLHCCDDKALSKEPWENGEIGNKVGCEFLRLRHKLFPYIYAANYRNTLLGEAMIKPMYYNQPKCDNAYKFANEYYFGDSLVVLPITSKTDKGTGVAEAKGYLPSGDWFDFFSGVHYHSENNRKFNFYRDINTIPVFAKAGAIIPMYEFMPSDNTLTPKEEVSVAVFPAKSGEATMFEDGGDGLSYKDGDFAVTHFNLDYGKNATFTISKPEGKIKYLPKTRKYNILLRGFNKNITVKAFVGGKEVKTKAEYILQENTTKVSVTASLLQEVKIVVSGKNLVNDNADLEYRLDKLLKYNTLLGYEEKQALKDLALEANKTVHERLMQMVFKSKAMQLTVNSVRELLTLTKPEH